MKSNLSTQGYNTDKSSEYIKEYTKLFADLQDKEVSLLELGVLNGGSLELWRDFFAKGQIVGIDINPVEFKSNDRIHFYQGEQQDLTLLQNVTSQHAPEGFYVIIDDASHFGKETFISFAYLFKNCLKSGGYYIIEDWGTGYWPHYPDSGKFMMDANHMSYHLHHDTDSQPKSKGFGAQRKQFQSHPFGMVGLIKQLVDELGIDDATVPEYTGYKSQLNSMIDRMIMARGQVIVVKK